MANTCMRASSTVSPVFLQMQRQSARLVNKLGHKRPRETSHPHMRGLRARSSTALTRPPREVPEASSWPIICMCVYVYVCLCVYVCTPVVVVTGVGHFLGVGARQGVLPHGAGLGVVVRRVGVQVAQVLGRVLTDTQVAHCTRHHAQVRARRRQRGREPSLRRFGKGGAQTCGPGYNDACLLLSTNRIGLL